MTIRENPIRLNNGKLPGSKDRRTLKSTFGSTKEEILLKDLKVIAKEFFDVEQLKKSFTNVILDNLEGLYFTDFIKYPKFYIKETCIKKSVTSANLRGLNVVSVDGSSVTKRFMNVDFSFLKAIAVKYYFKESHIANIEYFPDLTGFNNYFVQGSFFNRDENTVDTNVSMDMTYIEINLLNEMINRSDNIDFIIIDGSIVIMPINLLFSKDPEISKKYDRLLKEYHKLYTNCKERGIILIGSIKDTRTSALANLLCESIQLLKPSYSKLSDFIKLNYREIIGYFSDIDLFNRLLKKSERSCIFNCKREIDKIRDTGIKKEIPYYFPLDFYAFYLKTTKFDMPCRIEFFMDEQDSIEKASEKADLISSILLPISGLNEHYGLPIPQIEAHKRAVFKQHEVNLLLNNLTRNLHLDGISLLEKRRNRRPF
ncbi:MAG: DNA double-strand break repair nuclease NurA [Candidatus Lokiarchaeota archaeon]|nr:DNA double-strand break repair nuclease NurA [Candidatus Lokiarchaeota archaeon]